MQVMQDMWVWSLGQEDPLEEEMATHSSILAWKIPWTEDPGGLRSMGLQRVRCDWTYTHMLATPIFCFPCGPAGKESACYAGDLILIPGLERAPGEGKGYPLQYSGLENSMDCTVYGVAKSKIWLRDSHFHLKLCRDNDLKIAIHLNTYSNINQF